MADFIITWPSCFDEFFSNHTKKTDFVHIGHLVVLCVHLFCFFPAMGLGYPRRSIWNLHCSSAICSFLSLSQLFLLRVLFQVLGIFFHWRSGPDYKKCGFWKFFNPIFYVYLQPRMDGSPLYYCYRPDFAGHVPWRNKNVMEDFTGRVAAIFPA